MIFSVLAGRNRNYISALFEFQVLFLIMLSDSSFPGLGSLFTYMCWLILSWRLKVSSADLWSLLSATHSSLVLHPLNSSHLILSGLPESSLPSREYDGFNLGSFSMLCSWVSVSRHKAVAIVGLVFPLREYSPLLLMYNNLKPIVSYILSCFSVISGKRVSLVPVIPSWLQIEVSFF